MDTIMATGKGAKMQEIKSLLLDYLEKTKHRFGSEGRSELNSTVCHVRVLKRVDDDELVTSSTLQFEKNSQKIKHLCIIISQLLIIEIYTFLP